MIDWNQKNLNNALLQGILEDYKQFYHFKHLPFESAMAHYKRIRVILRNAYLELSLESRHPYYESNISHIESYSKKWNLNNPECITEFKQELDWLIKSVCGERENQSESEKTGL